MNIPFELDLVGIALVVTAIGTIILAARGLNRFLKKANQVLDDWNGTEGDEGHEAVPGVLKHFKNIDEELANNKIVHQRLEIKVDHALHELTTNNGSSLKDSVNKIALQQEEEVKERKAWAERYVADQHYSRLEWLHVFGVIRKMITLPPEEQLVIWDQMAHDYAMDELISKDDPDSTL